MFVPLVAHPDYTYSLQQRPRDINKWDFLSVWGIALFMLIRSPTAVFVRPLVQDDLVDGSVRFPAPAQALGPGTMLWPGKYKPPAQPKIAPETIDQVDGPPAKQKPRPQLGGVRAVLPALAPRVRCLIPEEIWASSDEDVGEADPLEFQDSEHEGGADDMVAPSPSPVVGELRRQDEPQAPPAIDPVVRPGNGEPGALAGEPAPVVACQAVGRSRRQIAWGPFQIAPVMLGGVQIGWGATCGRHRNATDLPTTTACKKQLLYGTGANTLTDAECLCLIKQWLIEGQHSVDNTFPTARSNHVNLNPRRFAPKLTSAELEALVVGA